MEFVCSKNFSLLQKWIIQKKLEKKSYDAIVQLYKQKFSLFNDNLSKDAIRTCLKRSSLSLIWTKGKIVGNIPVLSDPDIETLKDFIFDNAIEGQYIDVEDTIEKAEELRKERFKNARLFLTRCDCYAILNEVEQLFNNHEATRSWVYQHIDELHAQLLTPKNIEINRLLACTPEKISKFIDKFFPIVSKFHQCLRFTADETMLQPNINRKILVPNTETQPILPNSVELPHITATCCFSIIGAKMPLCIILPRLNKLPKELNEFANNGQAFFASSENGWQTRDTFLFFVICFINWLSQYRKCLDESIRNCEALLIVDGHKSRENAIALKMLQENNISLFVLPAHTSHLTQLFDVGIGSPMKSFFTDCFRKMLKKFNPESNQSAQLRRYCVESAILALDIKCNMKSCKTAASLTSTSDCNPNTLLQSRFVKELTPQLIKIEQEREKRRRNEAININCELITTNEFINSINDYLATSRKHQHLTLMHYSGNYDEFYKEIHSKKVNNCSMLSRFPDYLT